MKKTGFILMLLLISSSFSTKLIAQESLDALIKRCETMSAVDMNVTRSRDAKTKEVVREVITITFSDNAALSNQFLSAFKKEEANAISVTETRAKGRINSVYYRFPTAFYSYVEADKTTKIIITRGRDTWISENSRRESPRKMSPLSLEVQDSVRKLFSISIQTDPYQIHLKDSLAKVLISLQSALHVNYKDSVDKLLIYLNGHQKLRAKRDSLNQVINSYINATLIPRIMSRQDSIRKAHRQIDSLFMLYKDGRIKVLNTIYVPVSVSRKDTTRTR